MDRKTVIIIALAAIAAVGFGLTLLQLNSDPQQPAETSVNTDPVNQDAAPADDTSQPPESSNTDSYADFLGDANNKGTVDKTSETAVAVSIEDFAFSPTVITIKKGTVITWSNRDDVSHNVVSTNDSERKGLNSEMLSKGETYSHTFNTAGTYYYYCEPHPTQMRGVIVVTE